MPPTGSFFEPNFSVRDKHAALKFGRVNGVKNMNSDKLFGARVAAACMLTLACVSTSPATAAPSAFDGSWNLVFATRAGGCDAYNFSVNISEGVITHPNLVRFEGHVTKSGATHASVRVGDKFASGIGRLSRSSGGGNWKGSSGSTQCSGTWTAQRS